MRKNPPTNSDGQDPDRPLASLGGGGDDQNAVLARLAQRGDRLALERLLSAHADLIYATCVRMCGSAETARDLSQDAMVKLIEGLPSFDARARFSTWATRVVMNMCITHLRRERLRRHGSLDRTSSDLGGQGTDPIWATMAQEREPEASGRVESDEMLTRMGQAMQRLHPDARAILILRDVRDMDYAQIAEVLGTPVGTVESRIFRARAALREQVEAIGGARENPPDTRVQR